MAVRPLLNLLTDRLWSLPLAIVYLTERCNSRCVTCDYWQFGDKTLSDEAYERLLVELPRSGTRQVLLSGGEPTLHPRWAAIGRGFHAVGIEVLLVTNGLSLQRHADEVARWAGGVFVSLDAATPETYRAIRGVDGHRAVLDGASALVQRGVPVTFRCTVQRANLAELAAIAEQAAGVGARVSYLAVEVLNHQAFARGAAWDRSPAPGAADLPELTRAFAAVKRIARERTGVVEGGLPAVERLERFMTATAQGRAPERPRCNAPRFSAVFEPDGAVRPCYFLPPIGRSDSGPLLSALDGPAARAVRRSVARGEQKECATCVCPLYRGPRSWLGH